MKRYAMWSGGKDSGATIALCYEMGIELDGVVMSEIMFDKERGISAEHPTHINWVYNEGIPNIEKLGYKVIVLRGEKDYKQHFYGVIKQSKYPERIGKKHGFVMGGNRCSLKRDCKIRVLDKWCKQHGEFEKNCRYSDRRGRTPCIACQRGNPAFHTCRTQDTRNTNIPHLRKV